MIAFDSNILIYALEANPKFGRKSEDILIQASEMGGVCSVIAITETMYGSIDSFDKILPLQIPDIKVVEVDKKIAELAGKIKLQYNLKNIDSIHIATAILSKAKVFITNDKILHKLKIEGLEIHGL